MGWYERNIGYSRESRNYYRRSVIEEIKEERAQKKKQVHYAGIFVGNAAFLILTLILWFMSSSNSGTQLKDESFQLKKGVDFEVTQPGKIHEITLKIKYNTTLNRFERNSGVLMDVYGPEGKRIYSFYKNLWWYKEASDDHGASMPLKAEMILNQVGTYRVLAYVVDDEFVKKPAKLDIQKEQLVSGELTVKSRTTGSLYYKFLVFFLLGVLIVFLILGNYAGSPIQLWNLIKGDFKLLFQPLSLLYIGMIAAVLVLMIYWNYLGIGYAGYGDYLHSPNWFFSTDDVIYIG